MTMSQPEGTCVTICACTYRRPAGLTALLKGLAKQTFERRAPPNLRIVIADNEGSDRARDLCRQFGVSCDIPIEYVREPRRGISHARNAGLDLLRQDCDFFAMIDDDEIPDPDWIERLLLAQERTGADVVQGRVVPVFPDGAPDWIVQGRYFGWPRNVDWTHAPHHEGYVELKKAMTNNVLVRHAVVRNIGLRFDPQFGLTGGSDIVFFRAISTAGCRIIYAPDACVRDMIPLERANLRYLWWRWYRVGSNERFKRPGRTKSKWQNSGCAALATGLARLGGNLLKARTDLGHLAPGIKRVAHGLGQAASAIGFRYEQYRHEHAERGGRGRPRHVMDR